MIGKREDGKVKRGVGGKAFPHDYNWICNVCGNDCRSYEATCGYCEHDAFMAGETDYFGRELLEDKLVVGR